MTFKKITYTSLAISFFILIVISFCSHSEPESALLSIFNFHTCSFKCFLTSLQDIDTLVVGIITIFITIHLSEQDQKLQENINNQNLTLQKTINEQNLAFQKKLYDQTIHLQNREILLDVYRNFCKAHMIIYINKGNFKKILEDKSDKKNFLNELNQISTLLSESINQVFVLYSKEDDDLCNAVDNAGTRFREIYKKIYHLSEINNKDLIEIEFMAIEFMNSIHDLHFDVYFKSYLTLNFMDNSK